MSRDKRIKRDDIEQRITNGDKWVGAAYDMGHEDGFCMGIEAALTAISGVKIAKALRDRIEAAIRAAEAKRLGGGGA